jgi:hypothetical protein
MSTKRSKVGLVRQASSSQKGPTVTSTSSGVSPRCQVRHSDAVFGLHHVAVGDGAAHHFETRVRLQHPVVAEGAYHGGVVLGCVEEASDEGPAHLAGRSGDEDASRWRHAFLLVARWLVALGFAEGLVARWLVALGLAAGMVAGPWRCRGGALERRTLPTDPPRWRRARPSASISPSWP